MIQIYSLKNENYENNGDAVLNPIVCDLKMSLNDIWELILQNPIDENFEYIKENAVISVNTPIGKNQLFRINRIEKSDDFINAYAVPFLLTNDGYLFDSRAVNKNGQEALDIILKDTKIKGHSNIKKINTAYFNEMTVNAALGGDNDNSFLNRWGGEVLYNNYDLYINEQIGVDNHLRVEFGFNLLGVNESVDMSEVVTRIRPKAYNGYLLPNNETVDSSNIGKYLPRKFAPKTIEYNNIKLAEDVQENEEGVTVCKTLDELHATLRDRARDEFIKGKVDIPKIIYNVEMADLSKVDIYKEYKSLVSVSLGDAVHVKHKRLDIETSSRVKMIEWDCILEEIISLELGDYQDNLFNSVSSITSSINSVVDIGNNTLFANKIKGVIDLLNTSLRMQKDIAQRQDVRAILFEDLDTSSPSFGAMCIGTQGIQIAKKRNVQNTDWQWGTAIDFRSIYASYIIAGTITDRLGNNSWNLDSGELITKNMIADGIRATNADVTGKINAMSGEISGFKIENNKMVSIITKTIGNYTEDDRTKIMQFIMGQISLTEEEKERLNVSGSGYISSADYVLIGDLISGKISHEWVYKTTFSPLSPYSIFVLDVDYGGKTTQKVVSLESISKYMMTSIQERLNNLEIKTASL